MTPGEESTEAHDGDAPVGDQGFDRLINLIGTTYNFDVREYKEGSLARRIRARMATVHLDSFDAYSRYLISHPGEHVELFNSILINVTTFFRDSEAWRFLADEIVPGIIQNAEETRSIRVWSAGCSSGEEAYSVTMLFAEALGERVHDFTVKVYGTDIDEDALTSARHGLYRTDQLRDVPDALVDRYFAREGVLYRFRRDFRRWCIFGSHNLTSAPPLSHMDMVVCRNVLIYFNAELQDRVLSRFHYALRDDGALFLGRSESLLARSRLFRPRNLKWRIFQRSPAVEPLPIGTIDRVPAVTTAAPALDEGGRDATVAAGTGARRAIEALPFAVMVIDMIDTVTVWNVTASQLFDVPPGQALLRKFRDLDMSYRVEGLRSRIEDAKSRRETLKMPSVTFSRRNGELVTADIVIVPLFDGARMTGALVVASDATEQARLRDQMTRVAEQHATAIEELQSTNEELETTNEELQSTNEELETTNEELQSTNEELETTVSELQAANNELSVVNVELEARTNELNRLAAVHRTFLDSLEGAIVAVDIQGVVTAWNLAAQRLWAARAGDVIGHPLARLPVGPLARIVNGAVERVIRDGRAEQLLDVPFTPPDGQERRASIRVIPLRNDAGGITGALATMPVDGTVLAA
jgi:two-component system CheB/CheR fusion protein